jgi:hypothetical protein
MFSSGITSYGAATIVIDRHGRDNVTLLFADTLSEDVDNYRFNRDAEKQLGVPLTVVCDGRTPQQVLRDRRWIGNARIAPCSHLLKQVPARRWLEANCDPASTVLYVGLDAYEPERVETNRRMWKPWQVEFPLTEPPYYPKSHWLREAKRVGLEPPAMYAFGFPHANCGGACIRAGQGQWGHLLNPALPQRFADSYRSWEEFEQSMQAELGTESAILRDRRDDATIPLPLTVFRRQVEDSRDTESLFDVDDWGGCGCFTSVDAAVSVLPEETPGGTP